MPVCEMINSNYHVCMAYEYNVSGLHRESWNLHIIEQTCIMFYVGLI